jgi:hypothetical protein
MTDTALSDKALLQERMAGGSHWVRRTALVGFCLLLAAALGVVFTRAVAERVPEQRATLEKLITERTGLAVRFDNVHFAWGLDGTSAVFTRVELTDPKAGRVRVVAPELRVEFDTWDFMRHHQFSLGHVTLSSPDIEIIGAPEDSLIGSAVLTPRPAAHASGARDDEAALVRRYLSWAEAMPTGRIEVEAARVHLIRRGEKAARSNFTLSQAVISRGSTTFNAYGTMLLAQDVGQSLFLSAKLEGLGATSKPSGDLRLIARRVFLDKLALPGVNGRGTLDARLHLSEGKVDSGKWQASARELELNDDNARFDHLTVSGTLARDAGDVLLNFTDLQLTRGARLERAPNVSARLSFAPGSTRVARTTVRADRLPFMAAEFIAGVLAPQLNDALPAAPGGWIPTAGELHALRFDSGRRLESADAWTFSAQLSGAELARDSDGARISQLFARVRFDARQLELVFDPAAVATLRMTAQEPRPLVLAGHLAMATNAPEPSWRFDAFNLRSNDATLGVDGAWGDEASAATPLAIRVANLDRTLLSDTWTLLAPDAAPPALFAEVAQGNVVEGTLQLVKAREVPGIHGVNWQRSSGKLTLAQLATAGKDGPQLTAGEGALEFARGSTQLHLSAGEIEQLTLTGARLDWPRTGAPRMQASLEGALASPLLRNVLKDQGLERLTGQVAIEADARGERELRQPDLWRVAARIDSATVPLAGGLPAVEKLAGTLRYGNGQLRALALAGTWLGGPVEIELRRSPPSSGMRAINLVLGGAADAVPLLQLLGHAAVADSVDGQIAWSGSVQRLPGNDAWQISLTSNLGGIESRLPEPFAKLRARQLPVRAQLRVDAGGVREFEIDGDRVAVNGRVEGAVTSAHFVVQGIAGDLRRTGGGDPQLEVDQLDLKRAPALLAAAGALLPQDGDLALTVGDLRYSERSLGALHAAIARRASGVEFSIESPQAALHQLTAQGRCDLNDVCRAQFTADTSHLAALLRGVTLPAEWPTQTLHAAGELDWPLRATDLTRALTGRFDLETQGEDSNHQLVANATLADGQIQLANVQGSGPASDQVFRGTGRVSLVARNYDLTVDYEQVALAAAAVPTPARARVTRAWNALRGSVARRGWTEAPETRRVQWHGSWEGDRPD